MIARLKGKFPRLGMVWNIIRGYPVAYRIHLENGGLVFRESRNAMIVQCTVIGTETGAALRIAREDSYTPDPCGQCDCLPGDPPCGSCIEPDCPCSEAEDEERE